MASNKNSLTQAQLFGIALSSLHAIRNDYFHDRLYTKEATDENKLSLSHVLARDWSIHNADDLKSTLDSLTSQGNDSREFMGMQAFLSTLDHPAGQAFIDTHKKNQDLYAKLIYAQRSRYRLQRNGIFAWDCCRYIMLCRWGAFLGYLRDEDAWAQIMQMARNAQVLYSDWYEYGISYITGRQFWLGGISKYHADQMMDYAKQLFIGEDAPWAIPWDVDLSAD